MTTTQPTKGKEDSTAYDKHRLAQLPFRCEPEMEHRILRARGQYMVTSGEKITGNGFLQLIEEGLKKYGPSGRL